MPIEFIGKSAKRPEDIDPEVLEKIEVLAKEIAEAVEQYSGLDSWAITGGGSGYPEKMARELKSHGLSVYAFPPATSSESADALAAKSSGFIGSERLQEGFAGTVYLILGLDEEDVNIEKELKLFSTVVDDETQIKRHRYRSKEMNDIIKEKGGIALVIGGGGGTRRELVGALERGIPVGIFAGSGGIADSLEVEQLSGELQKDISDLIFRSDNPQILANWMVERLKSRQTSL